MNMYTSLYVTPLYNVSSEVKKIKGEAYIHKLSVSLEGAGGHLGLKIEVYAKYLYDSLSYLSSGSPREARQPRPGSWLDFDK